MLRGSRVRLMVALVVAVLVASVPIGPAWAGIAGAPTSLNATAGNTQVVLTWVAPASDGGQAITDYTLEYSPDAGTTWNTVIRNASTTLSYTFAGLTNGTTYTFRVSAVNGAGTGPISALATALPFVVHSENDPATFSACPAAWIPAAGFSDTTSTDVDCIKYYGITNGTTSTTYSPYDTVSRWQMALFLTRMATVSGITLGTGSDQGFTDITGESAEIQTAINRIKQLGITVGKTATTFAPQDMVTREEMALFIARLLALATPGPGGNTEYVTGATGPTEIKSNDTDYNFTDLPTGLIESRNAIVSLWNLAVTDVQGVTTYEPSVNMTRTSMATFIAKSLAHTNARPAGLVLQASGTRIPNGTPVSFSVTNRTAGFTPIAGTYVDTFRFNHSTISTVTRFDAAGNCTTHIIVSIVGNTKCVLDASDPQTDVNGNMATWSEAPPNLNFMDVWAWAADPTTIYDNDVHGSAANKVTIETHS